MKKILQYTVLTVFLATSSFISLNAQPHAGEQSGGAGVNGSRIGDAPSGAPIGSGNLLLLGLAIMYGTRKAFNVRKEAAE
jgi:hypothetical protein